MAKKLLFLFLFAFCACTQKQNQSENQMESKINDFDQVCAIARNFNWPENSDKRKTRLEFADKVAGSLPESLATQSIATAASMDEKGSYSPYEVFVDSAKEAGFTYYDCIPLKDHF